MNTPDLTGIRIIHRAMRADLHRLRDLAEDLQAGRQRAASARAAAIAGFTERICAAIHHHHTREDEVVWPLIRRSAGTAVDLTDLSDDHAELDPLLDRVRTAARAFATGRGGAAELADALRTLAELLDEHIEEEERRIFPVIEGYVSAADWKAMEKSLGGGDPRFELAWVDQYAAPEELAHIRKVAGPVLSLLLTLLRPGHRRHRRLVFGA